MRTESSAVGAPRSATTAVTVASPCSEVQTGSRWCRSSTTADARNDSQVGSSAREDPINFSRTRQRRMVASLARSAPPGGGSRPDYAGVRRRRRKGGTVTGG
jgi:hypothetical protein